MKIDKFIGLYGLRRVEVKVVDLRKCYVQQTPNRECKAFEMEGEIDLSVVNSPHADICSKYFNHGEKWLRKHYRSTRYYTLMTQLGKKKFPERIVKLCNSLQQGYLKKGHLEDYIVVLHQSFAISRYNRSDVTSLTPEIFSGHHRAGVLCSLGIFLVDVLFAEDEYPGSCSSKGKIHGLCIGE